ncbi:hypothetical protein AAMO2058_000172600 [Amorphochlora amoebiformis]
MASGSSDRPMELPSGGRGKWKTLGFARARNGIRTPYVFVANAFPPKTKVDQKLLREAFGRFGKVLDIVCMPGRGSSCANVVMDSSESAEAAIKAMDGLGGKSSHTFGRTLSLRFSELRRPKGPVEVVPDAVAKSAHMPLPEGLMLVENYISKEEEEILIKAIDNQPWIKDFSRRVQHYGYEFNYGTRNVDPDKPIEGGLPAFVRDILPSEQAGRTLPVGDAKAISQSDQCTVNEYLKGQGIRPHVDTPEAFDTHIVSLSLLSPTIMDFRYPGSKDKKSIVLPRRSLLILTGPSRHTWSHGIAHRSVDVINSKLTPRQRRVSLTLRRILHPETDDIKRRGAPAVERDYVHSFYDRVADHFSHTRWNTWPHVTEFLKKYLPKYGGLVYDVGCGNGKYLAQLDQLSAAGVGVDMCESLVGICRKRSLEAVIGDALVVPLRSNAADLVISIAVIHHLSTRESPTMRSHWSSD